MTYRLSDLTYKLNLQEYITITCLLILETLIQPGFLIVQILWKLLLLGNETSARGAHLVLFAVLRNYFYLCKKQAPVCTSGIHWFHSSDHSSSIQLKEKYVTYESKLALFKDFVNHFSHYPF